MKTYRDYFFYCKKINQNIFTDEVIFSLFNQINDFDKVRIIFDFDKEVSNKAKLERMIEEVANGIPYQYVIGHTYFLGNKFYVNKDVLIPRQETEELAFGVIKRINALFSNKNINVLDMCSGSGCIGISLKLMQEMNVDLVDISTKANIVAENNAKLNETKVDIYTSDLFNDLPLKKYDVIVCNPPYIKDASTVDKATLEHEPHIALFASPYTKFYEEIFKKKDIYYQDKYLLAFEIGEDMEDDLTILIKRYFDNVKYEFEKDIYGRTRFLYIISD